MSALHLLSGETMGGHYNILLTIILFVVVATFFGGLLWRLYHGDRHY